MLIIKQNKNVYKRLVVGGSIVGDDICIKTIFTLSADSKYITLSYTSFGFSTQDFPISVLSAFKEILYKKEKTRQMIPIPNDLRVTVTSLEEDLKWKSCNQVFKSWLVANTTIEEKDIIIVEKLNQYGKS